jgi:hypothetical protein
MFRNEPEAVSRLLICATFGVLFFTVAFIGHNAWANWH